MRKVIVLGAVVLAAVGQGLKFEVASVKTAAPATKAGTKISISENRLSYLNTTLKNALARAYELKFPGQVAGPSWITAERYDIIANAPEGTAKDQILIMLRTLLAERFELKLHHETRDLRGYALAIGKGKLGLRPSADGDEEGFDIVNDQRQAKSTSLASLARHLSLILQAPVLDETGLTGRYNFTFEQSMEETGHSDATSIVTIVGGLGLKLESRRVPLDVIVVDEGQKVPGGN